MCRCKRPAKCETVTARGAGADFGLLIEIRRRWSCRSSMVFWCSKRQKQQSPCISVGALFCMGTRRTVCVGEARFSGRLDFGGKFGVPQLVTINKSAGYGFWWNRIRIFFSFLHDVTF